MYCDLHCKKHHIHFSLVPAVFLMVFSDAKTMKPHLAWGDEKTPCPNLALLCSYSTSSHGFFRKETVCLNTFSMHQSKRTLSETQAGSAFSTRLTFACVVFTRRTYSLPFAHFHTLLSSLLGLTWCYRSGPVYLTATLGNLLLNPLTPPPHPILIT